MTSVKSSNRIPFWYVVTSTAMAANANNQQTLIMQADSWFELNTILGSCTEDADTDFMPNNFSVNLTDQASGRNLASARVPQRILCQPANGGLSLQTGIIFPPSANILLDFLNLTGNSNTVTLVLQGFKVFGL